MATRRKSRAPPHGPGPSSIAASAISRAVETIADSASTSRKSRSSRWSDHIDVVTFALVTFVAGFVLASNQPRVSQMVENRNAVVAVVAIGGMVGLWLWLIHRKGAAQKGFKRVGIMKYFVFALAGARRRAQLRVSFPADLAAPTWIDLSCADLSVFGLPKDMDLRKPLLWTAQTDALWRELVLPATGNKVRAQILAGPLGIGKSHIAALLALRCYAQGMPLLYIADTGVFLKDCVPTEGGPIRRDLVNARLASTFLQINGDYLLTIVAYRIYLAIYPHGRPFMRMLNCARAVVILDEHGHAYNALVNASPRLDPDVVCPLLIPNFYNDNRFIRCVFAGSNQANFERELNGTYLPDLRFITPFSDDDAVCFLSNLLSAKPSAAHLSDFKRLTNFVPREMIFRVSAVCAESYVSDRRNAMASILISVTESIKDSTRYPSMVAALGKFVHHSSMARDSEFYPFLDYGYIYRYNSDVGVQASPSCYPATLALLDLWRSVMPATRPRLVEIIRTQNGDAFEDLVWEVLLARYFEASTSLDCQHLGRAPVTEKLLLNLSDYRVSSFSYHRSRQLEVNHEFAVIRDRCMKWRLTTLYRCPKGCADVDFFVIHADGTCYAIQTSLSTLTAHSSRSVISNIPSRFGIAQSTLVRYIYVTTSPAIHQKSDSNAHVRIVDAAALIGF